MQKKETKLKLLDGENQDNCFALSRAQCVKLLCAVLVLLLSLSLTAKASSQTFNSIKTIHQSSVEELSFEDRKLAEFAVYSCVCASRTIARTERSLINAERLLAVERRLKIPEFMIGMSLAAACSESCYNEFAKGDRKFSKTGRPKAIGILQLWPWVKRYGVKRNNLESSATFWLTHIQRQLPKVKRRCKPRTVTLAWKQAWVTAVRAPKKGGRCREVTKHWRGFKKIQRFKKDLDAGIYPDEGDGC